MKRILLAVCVDVRGARSLGLGEVGVKEIPNEAAVTMAMQVAIPDAGFYIFPGSGLVRSPAGNSRTPRCQNT